MLLREFTRTLVLLCVLGFVGASAQAETVDVGPLKIENPWARATAPSAKAGGAFMVIENTGAIADRLVGARSDVAGRVEVHETSMVNNVMRMRPVGEITIDPGRKVELKPGGYHVMLMDLKSALTEGETFSLSLTFEKAGEVTLTVPIQAPGSRMPMHK